MKHAFKRLTALIMIMVFTCISLIGCTKQTHTNDIRKITLNEVAHSIFTHLNMWQSKKDISRTKALI